MTEETKQGLKLIALVAIGFLALKDIPVGDLFSFLASTGCGITQ